MPKRIEVTITVGRNVPARASLKERADILAATEAEAKVAAASLRISHDFDSIEVGGGAERSYKAPEPPPEPKDPPPPPPPPDDATDPPDDGGEFAGIDHQTV